MSRRAEEIAGYVLALVIAICGAVLLASAAACDEVEAFCIVKP